MQDQAHYETLKVVLKLIINTNPPNFYMLKHNCQEMLAKLENKTPTTPWPLPTYLSKEEEDEGECKDCDNPISTVDIHGGDANREYCEECYQKDQEDEVEKDELEIESFNLAMSYEL